MEHIILFYPLNNDLSHVEIELDAKIILDSLIQNNGLTGCSSPILNDCRALLSRMPHAKIKRCFRKANKCVDVLAKR